VDIIFIAMSDEISEENKQFLRDIFSQPEYKASHADVIQAQHEKNKAIDRERLRKDPGYQHILNMRELQKKAKKFYKTHGNDAFELMSEDLFTAFSWIEPEWVDPTEKNKNKD
jgi:hypothetical protein